MPVAPTRVGSPTPAIDVVGKVKELVPCPWQDAEKAVAVLRAVNKVKTIRLPMLQDL